MRVTIIEMDGESSITLPQRFLTVSRTHSNGKFHSSIIWFCIKMKSICWFEDRKLINQINTTLHFPTLLQKVYINLTVAPFAGIVFPRTVRQEGIFVQWLLYCARSLKYTFYSVFRSVAWPIPGSVFQCQPLKFRRQIARVTKTANYLPCRRNRTFVTRRRSTYTHNACNLCIWNINSSESSAVQDLPIVLQFIPLPY